MTLSEKLFRGRSEMEKNGELLEGGWSTDTRYKRARFWTGVISENLS